jgi:hypothetical protein
LKRDMTWDPTDHHHQEGNREQSRRQTSILETDSWGTRRVIQDLSPNLDDRIQKEWLQHQRPWWLTDSQEKHNWLLVITCELEE